MIVLSLDELDLRIIRALNDDARKTVLDISKEIHVSRPTISNRLRRLIEEGLISFTPNLDLAKLGFRTAIVGLSIRNRELVRDFVDTYSKCPRVLSISRPSEEFNVSVHLWGEYISTLEATIESMRNFGEGEIVFVHYSGPPEYPSKLNIQVFPEKSKIAPCGSVCAKCPAFIEDRCLGCPAVDCYKGPL